MVISFTIFGNHEGLSKNPIGYYRMTQRSKFKDAGAKRYLRWKDYVRSCLAADHFLPGNPIQLTNRQVLAISQHYPPFSADEKVRVDTQIFYKGNRRSDPENVRKGIVDALFAQDLNVVGCYDFEFDDRPRVEIEITGEL